MKFSLRVKLTAVFLTVTLILFTLVSVFANLLLEKQFKEYVISQQEKKSQNYASALAGRYSDWGGQWDVAGIESVGVNALSEGMILRLTDVQGQVIWDAVAHNSGMCAAMMQQMAQNMQSHNVNFQGGYAEKQYPIMAKNTIVGRLNVGYYGPYYYSDNDLMFLTRLNRLLLWAAAIATIISLLFGAYMAKHLSNPIARVINTAGQIAKGNFNDRVRVISSTSEITALTDTINRLAETLGNQEILRKRLTADVAHELRTPLAALQCHLEAMIDGIWQPDTGRLRSCHEETVRMAKMVGDLEKIARYEGENLVLDKKQFDVSVLLQRTATNFESEFRNKKIKLILNAQPQFIEADEDKLSQVFVNLVENALKYTQEGGTVEIQLTGLEKHVDVTIRDTGIGISTDDLPNIFERFYRVDKSRNRLTGGSGIGLTIVKYLVEAHHGSIEVKSEIGRGSEFKILLPK